jgi:DNA-binding beta-propeller fold protein YncE
VTAISVARAGQDPGRSIVGTAPAGCSPVRVAVSGDGRIVFVTARGSDELLAFSAARLRSSSSHPQVASVLVGNAPVGLGLVEGGRRIVVADSNRFHVTGGSTDLMVVSVPALLSGQPSVLGRLAAGAFPREMSLSPDGRTLLVTDFASGQLQTIGVGGLP